MFSRNGPHAFRWTEATGMQDLGTLPGLTDSGALGVSADGGTIVGKCNGRPIRWNSRNGLHDPLNIYNLGGEATASSADGRVTVGKGGGTYTAFRLEAGVLLDLYHFAGDVESQATDVSADGATIVGTSIGMGDSLHAPPLHAFVWTAATDIVPIGPVPTGARTRASAVSLEGLVVVGSFQAPNTAFTRPFRWTSNGFALIGAAPGADLAGYATDTNADGSVVVGAPNVLPDVGGFVWTEPTGSRTMRELLTTGVAVGWRQLEPSGLSGDGRVIVGWGLNPCGEVEAWRAVIDPLGPIPITCRADFNTDGEVNADDLADYINCFFSLPACLRAEFDGECGVNADDLADFINAFFAGCA